MKTNRKNKRLLIIASLSFVLAAGLSLAIFTGSYADEKTWDISFDKTSGNSALGVRGSDVNGITGYRAMQGIGFDTYSGQDGYVFMNDDDTKTAALAHFKMDENGFCTKVKSVVYQVANVGHSNDSTVYMSESGKKWLIFAPFGTFDEKITVKASDGSAIKLGAIDLSEYNNGTAKVYGCDVSTLVYPDYSDDTNNANITGITYKGDGFIDGERKPVFLIMKAAAVYEAYLTWENGKMKFVWTGNCGRIDMPKLPSGVVADTQGIVYHNGYMYITGEGKGSYAQEMVVARVSLAELFDGNASDYKTMEVYKDKKTGTVTKHGPEAAFFTSLNEKSHLYIGVNRVDNGKDDDRIERTPMRF